MEKFNWLGQRGSKHGLKSSNIVEILNGKLLWLFGFLKRLTSYIVPGINLSVLK